MTTLVVVRKNSEVAIAADSLTTFGDTRLSAEFDRTYDKIVRYRDTYVGLCGSAAHQLVFQSILARHEDLDFSTKAAIFETFRKLHPILKDQHFLLDKGLTQRSRVLQLERTASAVTGQAAEAALVCELEH